MVIPCRSVSGSERCSDAAVYIEDVAVHKGRGIAGQKDRRAGQLVDFTPAAAGRAVGEPAAERLVLVELLVEFGLEVARADAVGVDPQGPQSIAMPLVSPTAHREAETAKAHRG